MVYSPTVYAIKFTQVMLRDNRLPILGEIREALISCWGPQYGFGILNQQPIPENVTKEIIALIQTKNNDLDDVQRNIEAYLNEAKLQRDQLLKPKIER